MTVPVWLAIVVAIVTGLFALGGQALSGFLSRKSQEMSFRQQQEAERAKNLNNRLEEIYVSFFTHFDQVHDCIIAYRDFKKGKISAKALVKAIDEPSDNESYKRLVVLVKFYANDLGVELSKVNNATGKCADLLAEWRHDQNKDILEDLNRSFDEAKMALDDFLEKIKQKVYL